jgi:hypothetical protein
MRYRCNGVSLHDSATHFRPPGSGLSFAIPSQRVLRPHKFRSERACRGIVVAGGSSRTAGGWSRRNRPEIKCQRYILRSAVMQEIDPGSSLAEAVKVHILQTLTQCRGNRTQAAKRLAISVRCLRDKLRHYSEAGIEIPEPSSTAAAHDDRARDGRTSWAHDGRSHGPPREF